MKTAPEPALASESLKPIQHAGKQTSPSKPTQFSNNSRLQLLTQLQSKANKSAHTAQLKQLNDSASASAKPSIQRKVNNTGLPDGLKSGIENLSGYSMDDVKVHYNSAKPAQLQAHAYAQGSDIHLAPGQEKHLPHEAWHVVQQKQGRVRPTMQLKGVNVNDNAELEKEADVMGRDVSQPLQRKNRSNHDPNKVHTTRIGQGLVAQRTLVKTESLTDEEIIKKTGIQFDIIYRVMKTRLDKYHIRSKYSNDDQMQDKEVMKRIMANKTLALHYHQKHEKSFERLISENFFYYLFTELYKINNVDVIDLDKNKSSETNSNQSNSSEVKTKDLKNEIDQAYLKNSESKIIATLRDSIQTVDGGGDIPLGNLREIYGIIEDVLAARNTSEGIGVGQRIMNTLQAQIGDKLLPNLGSKVPFISNPIGIAINFLFNSVVNFIKGKINAGIQKKAINEFVDSQIREGNITNLTQEDLRKSNQRNLKSVELYGSKTDEIFQDRDYHPDRHKTLEQKHAELEKKYSKIKNKKLENEKEPEALDLYKKSKDELEAQGQYEKFKDKLISTGLYNYLSELPTLKDEGFDGRGWTEHLPYFTIKSILERLAAEEDTRTLSKKTGKNKYKNFLNQIIKTNKLYDKGDSYHRDMNLDELKLLQQTTSLEPAYEENNSEPNARNQEVLTDEVIKKRIVDALALKMKTPKQQLNSNQLNPGFLKFNYKKKTNHQKETYDNRIDGYYMSGQFLKDYNTIKLREEKGKVPWNSSTRIDGRISRKKLNLDLFEKTLKYAEKRGLPPFKKT